MSLPTIPIAVPFAHSTQPSIMMTDYVVDNFHADSCSGLFSKANLTATLRPIAKITDSNGNPGYLTDPSATPFTINIADLFSYIAQHTVNGDNNPANLLGLTVQVLAAEYLAENPTS